MGLDISLIRKKELSYEPSTKTTYATSQVIWEGRGRDLGYSFLEFTDNQLGCPLSVEELKELKEYLQQDLDSDDDFTKEQILEFSSVIDGLEDSLDESYELSISY